MSRLQTLFLCLICCLAECKSKPVPPPVVVEEPGKDIVVEKPVPPAYSPKVLEVLSTHVGDNGPASLDVVGREIISRFDPSIDFSVWHQTSSWTSMDSSGLVEERTVLYRKGWDSDDHYEFFEVSHAVQNGIPRMKFLQRGFGAMIMMPENQDWPEHQALETYLDLGPNDFEQ